MGSKPGEKHPALLLQNFSKDRLKKKFIEKKKQAKAKRRAEEDSDWEEMAKDAQLIKRLKSGKVYVNFEKTTRVLIPCGLFRYPNANSSVQWD